MMLMKHWVPINYTLRGGSCNLCNQPLTSLGTYREGGKRGTERNVSNNFSNDENNASGESLLSIVVILTIR